MNQYRKVTLKNGTRVVLIPLSGTAAVTAMTFYEVGSRYESNTLAGVSHFIEHMAFKGTKKRPTTMHLARELDSIGAEYNAYTDKDNTAYYVRLQAEQLPLAIDLLEDMVHHSVFRKEDLQSEVGVIIEELKMYDDNPMMTVEETMQQELFQGTPLGRKIGGTPKSVSGITRKGMLDFRNRYYRPSRTVVAIAGKFDEKEALSLVEAKFGRKKAPKISDRAYIKFKAPSRAPGPRIQLVQKETEQSQVAIGFPGFPTGHKRLAALNVMANILGGTMSSRLFLAVREKYGLAYHIRAAIHGFQDTGQLAIQAGLAKDHTHKAIDLIMIECRKITSRPVSTEELVRAQENIKGRLTLSLEDSSQLANWYGRQELLRRTATTPEEKIRQILSVTKEDIQKVAKDVIKPGRMAMAVIGPYEDAESFYSHAKKL